MSLNKSTSQRPASLDAGKLHDLQACFRAAGLAYQVTVSPRFAQRCGWHDPSLPGVDRYVLAWLVRLVLTGFWPYHDRQTPHGEVWLVEFPTFRGPKEAINLQLGIVVGPQDALQLITPEELAAVAPMRTRILLAEDDPELARVMGALLERSGFTVVSAPDGVIAWHLVQQQPFAAVILDIDMPGLTGIEVCQNIKASPTLRQLPVILCSGRCDLSELSRPAGADACLAKPAGILQLVALLNQLLRPPGVTSNH